MSITSFSHEYGGHIVRGGTQMLFLTLRRCQIPICCCRCPHNRASKMCNNRSAFISETRGGHQQVVPEDAREELPPKRQRLRSQQLRPGHSRLVRQCVLSESAAGKRVVALGPGAVQHERLQCGHSEPVGQRLWEFPWGICKRDDKGGRHQSSHRQPGSDSSELSQGQQPCYQRDGFYRYRHTNCIGVVMQRAICTDWSSFKRVQHALNTWPEWLLQLLCRSSLMPF